MFLKINANSFVVLGACIYVLIKVILQKKLFFSRIMPKRDMGYPLWYNHKKNQVGIFFLILGEQFMKFKIGSPEALLQRNNFEKFKCHS